MPLNDKRTPPAPAPPRQRPSKTLDDVNDKGELTPGGYLGGAAATPEDRAAGFSTGALLGQSFGVGGSGAGAQSAGHVTGSSAVAASSAKAGGHIRYDVNSPDGKFVARWFPVYNQAVSLHRTAVVRWLKPLNNQIDVARKLRDKFADKTGWWAGIEGFLTDPMAILGLATSAVSLGAGAALASKEALKEWNSEQGAEAAVKKLDAKINQLQDTVLRKANGAGTYRYMPDPTLAWEFYGDWTDSTDAASIPKGVVWFPVGHSEGILGTGPWPRDFEGWWKHKHKMLHQAGVRRLSIT